MKNINIEIVTHTKEEIKLATLNQSKRLENAGIIEGWDLLINIANFDNCLLLSSKLIKYKRSYENSLQFLKDIENQTTDIMFKNKKKRIRIEKTTTGINLKK